MTHDRRRCIAGWIGCALVGIAITVRAEPPKARPPEQIWPNSGDLLLREIARQGFFITERDAFGMPTRDISLREPADSDLTAGDAALIQPIATIKSAKGEAFLSLVRGGGEALWQGQISQGERTADYRAAVELAERLSRTEFPTVFRKAGLKMRPTSAPYRAAVAIPEAGESQLGQMDLCSQFIAVRAAHAGLRTAPDSTERLSALTRGYANLGQLTGYFWNRMPQTFAARSLLYAQRLVVLRPRSADALRNRAYAWAMAGLQVLALEDLDAADALAKADPADHVAPWAELIRPYCRYETSRLMQIALAADDQASALPLFLCFLSVQHSHSMAAIDGIGQLALHASPENVSIIDRMISQSGFATNTRLTLLSLASLGFNVPGHVALIPGIPPSVQDAATKAAHKKGDADPQTMAALAQALVDSARNAQNSGERDTGEPSLAVLGRMLQEAEFMAVERRAFFEMKNFGVHPRDFVERSVPLFASHPLGNLVQSYALPTDDMKERRALLQTIQCEEAQFKHVNLIGTLAFAEVGAGGNNPGDAGMDWSLLALYNSDTNSIDAEVLLYYSSEAWYRQSALKKLRETSPLHPALVEAEIGEHWDRISPHLAELEPGWGEHPTILQALAKKYLALNDLPNARKYLERLLEQAPDRWVFESLADTFLKSNDETGWLKLMQRGLAAVDYDLDHAHLNAEIADHYINKKEFSTAKPYADAAVECGASWAFRTAARCEEGLENWDAAEQYIRRDAERFNAPFAWLKWCEISGHGDRAAAIAYGQAAIASPRGDLTPERGAERSGFLLLIGDNKGAIASLRQMLNRCGDPWSGLHLALLLEAAHDTAARDAALKDTIDHGPAFRSTDGRNRSHLVELASLFRDDFAASPHAPLDSNAVDKIAGPLTPDDATDVYYMTAKLLDLRGQKQDAERYYKRASNGPKDSTSRILADIELRNIEAKRAQPSDGNHH